jgi:hypothetical protein
VVVALTALDISVEDTRFVKNGSSALDALLAFQQENGSFAHVAGGTGSQMATEQALYALVAARRAQEGRNALYDMSDAEALLTGQEGDTVGLPGKNPDVREKPVTQPGRTFSDISGHEAQAAIEALAAREIVDGKGEGRFDPEGSLTRAEFATLVTAALGLTPRSTEQFRDVTEGAWYAGFVGCAYAYGIVSGTGTDTFTPNGTITRQEAAVMVTAAARLCGLDTQMGESAIRDTLSQFSDYTQSPQWARPALAFCYEAGILDDDALEILPTQPVKRGEMALMLFRMLDAAELL